MPLLWDGGVQKHGQQFVLGTKLPKKNSLPLVVTMFFCRQGAQNIAITAFCGTAGVRQDMSYYRMQYITLAFQA